MDRADRAPGVHYVTDRAPGIRRKRHGRGFAYFDPQGRRITDRAVVARIDALAIPPAYRDVWIASDANAHLQATGRDARGRKQYRYHKRWRAHREETKFEHTIAFARALPAIRAAVERDLQAPDRTREQVLAAIVSLLESTLIRVGNDEYATSNGSYGLTTLRSQHVRVTGARIAFRFRGKSGVRHALDVSDARIARIVRACKDLPGADVFTYLDASGAAVDVKSDDVNAYLREIAGGDFTAKDFRTWAATISCAQSLARESEPQATQRAAKATLLKTIAATAERLGNTPAVCRKSYIHPAVLESYLQDRALELPAGKRRKRFSATEAAVLAFLERAARKAAVPLERQLRASVRARSA